MLFFPTTIIVIFGKHFSPDGSGILCGVYEQRYSGQQETASKQLNNSTA